MATTHSFAVTGPFRFSGSIAVATPRYSPALPATGPPSLAGLLCLGLLPPRGRANCARPGKIRRQVIRVKSRLRTLIVL